MAGAVSVNGLPFTSGSGRASTCFGYTDNVTFGAQLVSEIVATSTSVSLGKLTSGSSAGNVDAADIGASMSVVFSAVYRTT